MTHRGEQRGAHPVGFFERLDCFGHSNEPLMLERDSRRHGKDGQQPLVLGARDPAADDQHETVVPGRAGVAVGGSPARYSTGGLDDFPLLWRAFVGVF